MIFTQLDSFLRDLTDSSIIPAISVAVALGDTIVFSGAYGKIYESGVTVSPSTIFDIASMTKIISCTCFMKLVELNSIKISDKISEIFPEMCGNRVIEKDGNIIGYVNAGDITWYQALTHTTGMGWTRPKTRPSLPMLNHSLADIFSLPFACEPNKHIIYTDIPIILMGKAMEITTGISLDSLIEKMICSPLSMTNTRYLRVSLGPFDKKNIAPTEYDHIFRKCRTWGYVHDENAYLLDGVSAHAGIFSTAEDMCRFAIEFKKCLHMGGLLSKKTASYMIAQHVKEGSERRGLMWQLNGDGANSYTQSLSRNAYGHSGFTGCFLWTDPDSDISIVLLSNDVYNGREKRVLFDFRSKIMKLIMQDLTF